MKVAWNIFMVLVLIAGAGTIGYFIGHSTAVPQADSSDADGDVDPTPDVKTVPIRQGRVDRKLIAYGVVTAQAGGGTVLSVAFESRVKKILVTTGQRIGAATPVIELEPSSDTQLQILQAKSALASATQDLEQTRRRFNDHLATNQDLLQSTQNLQLAQLKLDSLQKEGAGGSAVQLRAAGLVARIDVQEGQIVPAGGPLVEIAAGGHLQVRLGVEPSDAGNLHNGDAVSLELVHSDAPPLNGKVALIAQRVNPDTRLTDIFVSIPPDAALPLDAYIRGRLTITGTYGLVVPHTAVLPDEDGFSLFTVDQDKATEHKVSIAAEDDDSTQITGDGLAAGQSVVVVGNMELENGMSVKADSAESPTALTSQEAAR